MYMHEWCDCCHSPFMMEKKSEKKKGNHDVHSMLFLVRFRSASDSSLTTMRLHDIVILDVCMEYIVLLRNLCMLYTYCVQRPRRYYSTAEGLTKKKSTC